VNATAAFTEVDSLLCVSCVVCFCTSCVVCFSCTYFFLQYNAYRASSAATSNGSGTNVRAVSRMPIIEAQRILNVEEPLSVESVNKAFERMYDANSPEKGNSFYLQSKVYRARESLIAHLDAADNDADLTPPAVADKQ
jgi:hypothetical protein